MTRLFDAAPRNDPQALAGPESEGDGSLIRKRQP